MAEDQSKLKRPRFERTLVADTFMNNLDADEVLLLMRLVADLDWRSTAGNGGFDTAFSRDEINLIMKFKDTVEREELNVD